MEYIYGISTRFGELIENLKTIDSEKHSDLSGFISSIKEFDDGTKIEDKCRIVKKYASKESNGKYYDWYLIDSHYRIEDKSAQSQKNIEELKANLDYVTMMTGVDIPVEEVQ